MFSHQTWHCCHLQRTNEVHASAEAKGKLSIKSKILRALKKTSLWGGSWGYLAVLHPLSVNCDKERCHSSDFLASVLLRTLPLLSQTHNNSGLSCDLGNNGIWSCPNLHGSCNTFSLHPAPHPEPNGAPPALPAHSPPPSALAFQHSASSEHFWSQGKACKTPRSARITRLGQQSPLPFVTQYGCRQIRSHLISPLLGWAMKKEQKSSSLNFFLSMETFSSCSLWPRASKTFLALTVPTRNEHPWLLWVEHSIQTLLRKSTCMDQCCTDCLLQLPPSEKRQHFPARHWLTVTKRWVNTTTSDVRVWAAAQISLPLNSPALRSFHGKDVRDPLWISGSHHCNVLAKKKGKKKEMGKPSVLKSLLRSDLRMPLEKQKCLGLHSCIVKQFSFKPLLFNLETGR